MIASTGLSQLKAHTPREGDTIWHGLDPHLLSVARIASRFAEAFQGSNMAYLAGLWHDLGKVNPKFQTYLVSCQQDVPGPKVPHAIWGAAWAYHLLYKRLDRDDGWQELALCILGHHAGLLAPGEASNRLDRWWQENQEARELVHQAAQLLPIREPEQPPPSECRRELWLRMLFSALVDADYLDTEQHFKPGLATIRGEWARPVDLWSVFRPDHLRLMWAGRGRGRVNRVRRRVYWDCVMAAKKPPGVFRLTVPTGGGKTRAGLAFALRHAVEYPRHAFRRVIVALPYTSIIDQTAAAYRQIFGDRLVLEHHSQADLPDAEAQDAAHIGLRLAEENWDHPLVVTTTVQLLESLFSNKPGRCRKLHNIAHSIIILDEVQTLPPELLAPTLDVLRSLVNDYGVTLVLSTATQPAFDQTPYLTAFDGLKIEEIVPRPERYFLDPHMMRVEYQPVRQFQDLDQLADELCQSEASQCMVILNTRKHAMTLHEKLSGRVKGLYHLSTLLCGTHRKRVLSEIGSRLSLSTPEPVVLVSTQVVEAGVDLDFPVVYRAMGPLDRIVQAAGRCNREGRRPSKGQVTIFDWPDNASPSGSYKIGLADAKILLGRNDPECLHDPALHTEYFQWLFRDVDTDKRGIQPYRRDMNYPEVAKRYRLIEETVAVVIPAYDNGEGERRLQAHLRAPSRDSWRHLLPYVVNLRQRDLQKWASCLEQVTESLYRWNGPYDDKTHRGIVADVYDPADLIQ